MKKLILFLLFIVLFYSCYGNKKQTLEKEETSSINIAPRDSIQESIVVYNAAKAEESAPPTNEAPLGSTVLDANNPPIKLNLGNDNLGEKEIDIADYYTKVSYVKLKHPLPANEGGFLGDASFSIKYKQGSSSMMGINSKVFLSDKKIIAGDNFYGYHVYDQSGKFLYTLAQMTPRPEYTAKSNSFDIIEPEIEGRIDNVTVLGNNAFINTREDNIGIFHTYDLDQQKGISALKIDMSSFQPINSKLLITFKPYGYPKYKDIFLRIIDVTKGVIRKFENNNPSIDLTSKQWTMPEAFISAYYNDVLTIRQAYNDTVYRIKDDQMLHACYVLDMGKRKLSIQDAATGSKIDKLIVRQWLEAENFIFIATTINHDTPNNRDKNVVQYRYYYYDKASSTLYAKTMQKYPEEYTMPNSLPDAAPFLVSAAKTNKKRLYTSLTKKQFEKIMKGKDFSKYADSQQKKMTELYNSLDDRELLVMILE